LLLRDVQKILDADVLVGADKLDIEVHTAFAADLMSDVLAFADSGCILLTGLTNPQVIRTADVLDIAAIVLVRGKRPPPETLRAAMNKNIPLLATKFILFETAGRLYEKGIVGSVPKVEGSRVRL
jgi:hypothetical protein